MLGGSAVHFSLAASFFTDVRVVGPVGDDFGDERVRRPPRPRRQHRRHRARRGRQDLLLARPLRVRPEHRAHRRHAAERVRRVRAEALRRVEGGRRACSSRTSSPTCSARCASSARARGWPGLDSMNLWIETAKDSLVRTIGGVDLVFMNDAELRHAHRAAEPGARRARGDGDGPARRDREAGRVRRGAVHGDGFFALPAYPLETVNDPTGAGDSFAGGFLGYLASQGVRRTTRRCAAR